MVSLGLTRSSTHRAAEPTSHGMHPPKKKIRLPCKWGNIHHRFEPFRVPAFINFCFFWARMLNSSKLSKFYRHIHMANDFEVIIDPENRNRRFLRSYRTLKARPNRRPKVTGRDSSLEPWEWSTNWGQGRAGPWLHRFRFFFWLVVWNMLYFPYILR
jgi:hypothetical protein